MKRVSLKQQFTGEPTMEESPQSPGPNQDQVDLEVQGGMLVMRVLSSTPDEEIFREEHFQKFMSLELKLEQGRILEILISEGTSGVDVRLR